jgi:hypothetical protein
MPTFDRSLLHNYAEWEPIVPNFNYHGMNAYAYILERYGKCGGGGSVGSADGAALRNTFDFVTIQLYEGYSHAEYNTTQLHVPPAEYVTRFVQSVLRGWDIDYSTDAELQFPYVRHMRLDRTQLVVGLSNGWAGDGKFFLLYPEEVSCQIRVSTGVALAEKNLRALLSMVSSSECRRGARMGRWIN